MKNRQDSSPIEVTITKLVHGGQGMGQLPNGKTVFVWNALPGEKAMVRLIKQKRHFAEGIAVEVVQASPERIEPQEANYLATSPWQIMDFDSENRYKKNIIEDLFGQHKVVLPEGFELTHDSHEWQYRNKMEYSFWGDEQGLHLALHKRGSHGKDIVTGSALAMPAVDAAANKICTALDRADVRAGDVKTIIVRCSQDGRVAASLFVKPTEFMQLSLPAGVQGLRVYHSNPKSPASVPTKLLYELGDSTLQDKLLGKSFAYDVDSFFQVNLPIFEHALRRIRGYCYAEELVDMYAGVGSIGLSVAKKKVDLIELDPATAKMARANATNSDVEAEVIETPAEKALDYITADKALIVDPPRAGLHDKVVAKILEAKPPSVVYLSCNPATQARDIALLQAAYTIKYFEAYNFFPRTPHIETLAILAR